MSKGWISLDRGIRDHFLYQEDRVFSRYEAWVDLLLSANHSDNKTLIDGELQTIKRGTFITSIRKLEKSWKWSNSKVLKFFELLENEGMATRKSDTKKTLVTIINYDNYQKNNSEKRHQNDSEATQKHYGSDTEATQKHTNNNVNNANNSNNVNNGFDLPPSDIQNNINVFKEIEKNFGRPLSPIEMETISQWQQQDKYPDDLIFMSLQEAVLNQAFSLKYMDRILLSWERKGIKSKNQAIELIKRRKESKVVEQDSGPIDPVEIPKVTLHNWLDPEED